ncbi:MAG: hypothetical protein K2N71_07635 [Oscillospiraceae bacterium]|nr:hypothetical protein [Oscillospiraceae bacterium]
MKKIGSLFIASVIAILICAGCSSGNESTDTAANDITVSTSETSTTETKTETEVQTESETETETELQTETETETQTETELQTEEVTFLAEEDGSSAEYGNDITGYIYLPAGWEYSENELGEFTAVSPDGLSRAESILFTGFAGGSQSSENGHNITVSASGQTAMMFCHTVALNSEIEGYDSYEVIEIQCGDISGFCAVMLDTDTDLGFRYYAAFPDEESGNIYAVKTESSDCTVENMSILGAAVDGYHRISDKENR